MTARQEYEKLLKSMDAESKRILSNHVNKLQDLLENGGISVNDMRRLAEELETEIHNLIKSKSVIAIDFAKKTKAAELGRYLADIQRLLVAQNVPTAIAKEMTTLSRVVPVYGGGMDDQILNSIWHKVWPDSLNVDGRIRRLSAKAMQFTEQTVKQGISEGKSAANIAKELRQHFEVEGLELKAAFRLAAHTTNMSYQAAQAEISIQAKFVMGIRIIRAPDGDEKCDICAEHAGEVGGPGKEYFKDDFGGRSYDLYVMTNAPAYHSYCKCEIEDIFLSASDFVSNFADKEQYYQYQRLGK